jgi:DNA ligase-1
MILPFQTLTQRSRKHVNEKDLKTKIAVMAFDILYLNNESLLEHTFENRRKNLRDSISQVQGKFMFAKNSDTSDFDEL